MKTILTQSESGVVWNAKGDLQSIANMNYIDSVDLDFNTMAPHSAKVQFWSDAPNEGEYTYNTSTVIGDWVDINGVPQPWGDNGLGGTKGDAYTLHWPTPTITQSGSNNDIFPATAGSALLSTNPSFSVGQADTGDIQAVWTGCYISNDYTGTQVNDPEIFNITLRAVSQY